MTENLKKIIGMIGEAQSQLEVGALGISQTSGRSNLCLFVRNSLQPTLFASFPQTPLSLSHQMTGSVGVDETAGERNFDVI